MSIEPGIFASIQLRSSTPGPNEKVFQFLQGMAMAGEEPDDAPPRSVADASELRNRAESALSRSPQIYSPAPRSKASATLIDPNGLGTSYPRARSKVDVGRDGIAGDDADSNVQEGMRSEVGEAIPFREPGPQDLPGPKYASYDSGPSFGNFGPLPADDHLNASNNPYAHPSWNPVWEDIINKPNGDTPRSNGVHVNATGLTEGGLSAYPAGLSSPPGGHGTPRRPSVIIDVESPSSKSGGASKRAITTSPKPTSRAQSRATNKGEVDQRPWSPFSGKSKVTRATEKGTVYPPLPASTMGVGDGNLDRVESLGVPFGSPVSKSRARSMAPSISPSDSPSQRVQLFASKSQYTNGGSRSPPPGSVMSGGHQNRPFSPYRHAPTQEDLLNAAVRGRALAIPEEPEKERSVASTSPSKMPSRQSKALSHIEEGKPLSQLSAAKESSAVASHTPRPSRVERDHDATPTPSRRHSPEAMDDEEVRIVNDALAAQTPRTSIYAAPLEPGITSHFHDMELCILLHQENDPAQHEIVKKALRKAVRQRVKKLGMKYDNESIRQYRKTYHDHDPSIHLRADYVPEEPPKWASDLKREIVLMQQRIESLGPKIEGLRDRSFNDGSRFANEADESTESPVTQTVNIQTQPTGTLADSMYHTPGTDVFIDDDGNVVVPEYDDFTENRNGQTDGETRSLPRSVYQQSENDRDDSPGKQYLEEELYKLRQKPHGSQSGLSHKTWEVARDDDHDDYENNGNVPPSGLPTIPDTNADDYPNERDVNGDRSSPPLPDLPEEATETMAVHAQGPWGTVDYSTDAQRMSPWQRIHGRLLSWAIVWPMSEFETALNSTTRGQQVDEVALSIWSTQTYKRYVRARLTDSPHGVVDRLFVPPNVADTISNAVFNGRHGDACGMLRDLWAPFGLEGMPRLLVVLAKHRSDPNHWVVHRFSLPDGGLTTYDSYPERTLPDGRPLGWWFAIRVAWPNAMYPSPDHLIQKMVRLHRPLQLPIDNSVAAAGIWRNILMGSRAERSLDLERLRDLINTEVKNLKQRKNLGKLSVGMARPAWEDMS